MKPYKQISGKPSGVMTYSTGEDFILVQFKSGEKYRYTYKSAGEDTVEKMRSLAEAGSGLSTFISREKPPYEEKLDDEATARSLPRA